MSEQRRAAEEIRFQAGLLDAVDQAVIAADINRVITYWNRFAESLYGWSAPEVIGRNVIDVIPAQGVPRAAAEMLSRWQRGESWTGELLVQHRIGTMLPILVTDSPIYNSQGVLIGIVRVAIDITDRKRAEEDLERRVVERTTNAGWSTTRWPCSCPGGVRTSPLQSPSGQFWKPTLMGRPADPTGTGSMR